VLLAPESTAVIVVAGLPGAGKTTLVASDRRALDSDALREAWAPRLARLPYRLWRPLVHARHWVAIWRALKRPDGVIIVRPFTSSWLRRAVLRRAGRNHPAVHLVVVDATTAQARAGQRARGRTVREPAMRRHERRWARADFAREPWTTVTRVRRPLRPFVDEPPHRCAAAPRRTRRAAASASRDYATAGVRTGASAKSYSNSSTPGSSVFGVG
jgi:predicted kinase